MIRSSSGEKATKAPSSQKHRIQGHGTRFHGWPGGVVVLSLAPAVLQHAPEMLSESRSWVQLGDLPLAATERATGVQIQIRG